MAREVTKRDEAVNPNKPRGVSEKYGIGPVERLEEALRKRREDKANAPPTLE